MASSPQKSASNQPGQTAVWRRARSMSAKVMPLGSQKTAFWLRRDDEAIAELGDEDVDDEQGDAARDELAEARARQVLVHRGGV